MTFKIEAIRLINPKINPKIVILERFNSEIQFYLLSISIN